MAEDIQARITVSQPRRWVGVGMLIVMGALLIWVALAQPPAFGWQLFLIGTGLGALWIGEKMRRATEGEIILAGDVLQDQNGDVIARLEEIEKVERGMFAFKPSNGFILKTKTRLPRRWEPGVWWRAGRRIGVGGVTAAAQGKIMADLISAKIAMREAGSDGGV
jgi:hypothetical protein